VLTGSRLNNAFESVVHIHPQRGVHHLVILFEVLIEVFRGVSLHKVCHTRVTLVFLQVLTLVFG